MAESIQEKYQRIMSNVEDVGLPEGEYLRVCNALQSLFKDIPPPKMPFTVETFTYELPVLERPTLRLINPLHDCDVETITITFNEITQYKKVEKITDNHTRIGDYYAYNLSISTHTVVADEVIEDNQTVYSFHQKSVVENLFDDFIPRIVSLEIGGQLFRYDVYDWIQKKRKHNTELHEANECDDEHDDFTDEGALYYWVFHRATDHCKNAMEKWRLRKEILGIHRIEQ